MQWISDSSQNAESAKNLDMRRLDFQTPFFQLFLLGFSNKLSIDTFLIEADYCSLNII